MNLETNEKPVILVVDDEKENLTGFKYLFDDIYDVFTAESAAEGRSILEQHDIQVVISDQRMPETTGVEFLQQVRSEFPDTVRMILTGYSDFDAIIDAVNKGNIYYYFSKPWNESEMKMIIENAFEAVQLKKQLQQNQEWFKQLSDNIREVFWLISVDWTKLFHISSGFEPIFMIDWESLYENPLSWLDSVVDEDLEQVKTFIEKAKRKLDSRLNLPEFRILLPDNSIRWLSFKLFPVKDQKGRTYRYAGLMENISEQKQTVETRVQSEKMVSMGGLAAGIAHELNSPLSGIINGVLLLQKRLSASLEQNKAIAEESEVNLEGLHQYLEKRKVYKMLEDINQAGKRAALIISDMLSFSRKSDPDKGEINIQTILDNIINVARSDHDLNEKYDFKSITIIKEFNRNLSPVFGNEIEIEQVILNLLRNAAQAMKLDSEGKDHRIIVRARPVKKNVLIEVEDNGPGMEESIMKRVFEPFFTTKSKNEGTGLGLSISHKIINNNHKGSLSVSSRPGQGTTFTILLPCSNPKT